MKWSSSHRDELLTGLLACLVSMGVYLWSTAPNVTLLDSGEFIVAAQHFGVPHPTGYPLWTILAWLFQLLPLGNAAWEINLFSGVCGALAVGVTTGMLVNLLRWFLADQLSGRLRWLPPMMALSFGLMFAFSVSMWSQAVIAEVYTLHALVVSVYLVLLYGWVRNPSHDHLMLWAFFVLALAFSNHHLTLTLAPIPYLLILLLRRRALADWILAGVLTVLLGYLLFAILSEDLRVLRTAIRLAWVVLAGAVIFVWVRKLRVRWKLVALLPFAVGAGLLPYAYMPLASSTNPPMNWGYAREMSGFFYSVNRSQYHGSLTDQSVRILGPLLGTKDMEAGAHTTRPPQPVEKPPWTEAMLLWVGFFWGQLAMAFTPLSVIGYFASIVFILWYPLAQRTWIYCLHFAFILAAFLQPLLDGATIDGAGWWLQMPYHTYTNLIYALLSGLGVGLIFAKLASRRTVYFWFVPLMLVLPMFTFRGSEPVASQRDRWFGWQFGYDMLKDLPQDAVVIGGTDPGRFVPTYMIFGESPQPPHLKRDPDFDRRDLFIITQNALGDPFYMSYIRDHYAEGRPQPRNAFERWLGRAEAYPQKTLILPTQEEIKELLIRVFSGQAEDEFGDEDNDYVGYAAVLKWIWEHNRDQHEFFIEESFPMRWTYDYAVPEGLIYRLNPTKLEELPPEVVERDFAFWADYKRGLLENPEYERDLDAQRSFSKLRQSIANIYRHRGMRLEAERAYREALELWPGNVETIMPLLEFLWEEARFDEAMDILQAAYGEDPNNTFIVRLAAATSQRAEFDERIRELRANLAREPEDAASLEELVELYMAVGETNRVPDLIQGSLEPFATNARVLRMLSQFGLATTNFNEAFEAAKRLSLASPNDATAHLLLSRTLLLRGMTNEAYGAARRAIELGGRRMREAILIDLDFQRALEKPPFKTLREADTGSPGE